jgi:acyl-CoA thioester hydrolase
MKLSPTTLQNTTSVRVIYGDTDQMGIVYYANYLRWFEKGRSEFLRHIGLTYAAIEQQGFHFPVIEVSCRYIQAAHYDDIVKIETTLAEMGRAQMTFFYRITREPDDALLAEGSTRHACILSSGRPVRMPKALLEALARAREAVGNVPDPSVTLGAIRPKSSDTRGD